MSVLILLVLISIGIAISIGFLLGLIISSNKYLKNNFHIIIPFICVIIYALIWLFHVNFILGGEFDFYIWYIAGKQALKNPARLYDVKAYVYMPARACLFAVTFSLLPLIVAAYIHYILIFFFALIYLREFDRILKLFGLNEKIHRFLFLMILSNGAPVLGQFMYNCEKYLAGYILFYIVRKTFEFRELGVEKNLKETIIIYGMFVFLVSTLPNLIILMIIYIFHDVNYKDLFKKRNITNYLIVIGMFAALNFLFIIYPRLIFVFLFGGGRFLLRTTPVRTIISLIILIIITIILLKNKTLKLEMKFAWYSFAGIFFDIFSPGYYLYYFPLSFLIFLPFLDLKDKNLSKFISNNFLIMLGLLIVQILFWINSNKLLYNLLPIPQSFAFQIDLMREILLVIYGVFLLLFIYKRKKELEKKTKDNDLNKNIV